MGTHRAVVVAIAFFFFVLLWGPPARADITFPFHDLRLANGLRVILSPDPTAPDVSVIVRYQTGSRDEPAGLEGLAHVVEHALFLGSKHVPPGHFARLLEQAGATRLNGTTSPDTTVYYETLPPERLELALWLESDRMGYGLDRFDESALARAKAEVLNEHRDRVLQRPLGGVPGFVYATLFPSWHPYHHLPIASPDSIERISLADVRAFFDTWYGASNAVLVITGNIDPKAAAALAGKYFGSLPARKPPERPAVPAATATAATVLQVGTSSTRNEIRLAWVTPRLRAPGDGELDIAAAILVQNGAGWLERAMFSPPRLCTSVTARQSSMELASVFEITAEVAPGRNMRDALWQIVAALKRFETDVTDSEIERARVAFRNETLFELQSTFERAQVIARVARVGPLPAAFDANMSRYSTITPAAVRSAVQTWLGAKPWVITVAHPMGNQPVSGSVLKTQEVAW